MASRNRLERNQDGERLLKHIGRQTAASEKALILQFRPKVVVRVGGAVLEGADSGSVDLYIVNVGSNDAEIREIACHLLVTEPGHAPVTHKVEIQGTNLAPGESRLFELKFEKNVANVIYFTNSTLTVKGALGPQLTLMMNILYSDKDGTQRRTGLRRLYEPSTRNFRAREGDDFDFVD